MGYGYGAAPADICEAVAEHGVTIPDELARAAAAPRLLDEAYRELAATFPPAPRDLAAEVVAAGDAAGVVARLVDGMTGVVAAERGAKLLREASQLARQTAERALYRHADQLIAALRETVFDPAVARYRQLLRDHPGLVGMDDSAALAAPAEIRDRYLELDDLENEIVGLFGLQQALLPNNRDLDVAAVARWDNLSRDHRRILEGDLSRQSAGGAARPTPDLREIAAAGATPVLRNGAEIKAAVEADEEARAAVAVGIH